MSNKETSVGEHHLEQELDVVEEMPKSGQFVRVWHANRRIWSDVLRWNEGELQVYMKDIDEFIEASASILDTTKVSNVKYIIDI